MKNAVKKLNNVVAKKEAIKTLEKGMMNTLRKPVAQGVIDLNNTVNVAEKEKRRAKTKNGVAHVIGPKVTVYAIMVTRKEIKKEESMINVKNAGILGTNVNVMNGNPVGNAERANTNVSVKEKEQKKGIGAIVAISDDVIAIALEKMRESAKEATVASTVSGNPTMMSAITGKSLSPENT